MLTSSLLMDVFTRITPPQTEILLSALYGGIFSGVGLGLVFLGGASTGGSARACSGGASVRCRLGGFC